MPEVDLAVNLQLELTTDTGGTAIAQVHGTGSQLKIAVDQPRVLLHAIGRVDLGRFAELLDGLGVTAIVVTSDGQLARIGSGVHSLLGRVVAGSKYVAPNLFMTLKAGWF